MKKVLIIFGIMILALSTKAQDIHFSQYYAQPMLLNPALSGLNTCDYRVGAIFRAQWFSLTTGNTYRTTSAFADMAVFKPMKGTNFLGAGISFYSDQAGDLNYSTNQVDLSLAYHIILDKNTKQSFSIGLQGGFAHKSLDQTKAIFEYDPITGNPILTNSELIKTDPLLYGDATVGFLWSIAPKQNSSYNLGFAVHHLNQPNTSGFYSQNQNEKKHMKLTGHFGSLIPITKQFSIMPGFMVLKQGPSVEATITNYFKYRFGTLPSDKTAFYIGTMYRVLDAAIIAARFDIDGFSFNFSYDFNVSKLTTSTNANGGPEIAVSYTGCIKRKVNQSYCPDF